MGANQSYEGDMIPDGRNGAKGAHNSAHHRVQQQQQRTLAEGKQHRGADGGKKHKAKPGPPHKPKVVDRTYNSITLSWQPPRHNPHSSANMSPNTVIAYTVEMAQLSASGGGGGESRSPGHWTTLTKTCQATSYTARDLKTDTTYAFRVRAENVYGVGKPSVPNEPATTHMFERTSDDTAGRVTSSLLGNSPSSLSSSPPLSSRANISSDRRFGPGCDHQPSSSSVLSRQACQDEGDNGGNGSAHPRLRRRHSFNVHLDGGAVTKIVNHSDVVLTSAGNMSSPSSSDMPHSLSCHAALSPAHPSATSPSSLSSSSSTISHTPSDFATGLRYSDRRRGGTHYSSTKERSPRLSHERTNNSEISPSSSVSSLCRKGSHNSNRGGTSSQGRKISLPILLPGTGTASLSRLRESRTSLRSSVSDVHSGEGHGQRSREVMLVTVGRGEDSSSTSRRHSNGSVGSGGNNSRTNAGRSNCNSENRHSRVSVGSGGSEVTSSRMSLEDSASSDASKGVRTSMASSTSSGEVGSSAGSGGRCGSLHSLSQRSSHSDATLSNSKDGSKDSLCDISGASSRSSVGEGNCEDLPEDNRRTGRSFNEGDDNKLDHFNNNNGDIIDGYKKSPSHTGLEDDDDMYKLKEELKNFEITVENLRFHDLGQSLNFHEELHSSDTDSARQNFNGEKGSYYASLENPWEMDTSASGLSERILAAPFCDDIKMALYARDLPENSATLGISANGEASLSNSSCHPQHHISQSTAGYGEAGDFRTLRSVLQSNNMFVKAQRFSPDVVGVVVGECGDTCRTLTRARLTTIADADEDEDAVRITAL